MDLDWFFRIYKNNPGRNGFPNENQDNNGDKRDKCEDLQDFSILNEFNAMENSFYMFRQMNEMLRMFSYPSIDSEIFSYSDLKEKSPRSAMLNDSNDVSPTTSKFRNERPVRFQDPDIDDLVAKCKMEWDTDSTAKPETHFYKKFSSIRRVHLPDGTVEEQHVTSDSKGNKTTTVRRSLGDQTHELITHCDTQGLKETVENFKNLDEKELQDFNKRWKSPTVFNIADTNPCDSPNQPTYSQVPAVHEKPNSLIDHVNPPAGDSIYAFLFKKFFGQ